MQLSTLPILSIGSVSHSSEVSRQRGRSGQHLAALTWCLRGIECFQKGAYAQAQVLFQRAIAQIKGCPHLTDVEAVALGYLGRVYSAQQQYWFALACYEAALDLCQTPLAHPHLLAHCQMKIYGWMADLCHSCRRHDLAAFYCTQALSLKQGLIPTPNSITPLAAG